MDLKGFRISTIIVVIALLVISLYAITEVTYFSAKNNAEPDNVTVPIVSVPAIGVNEKINNVSISQGVYHDEESYAPTKGDVVLFGHRTLQGSPFLRLNELKKGDIVTLQWPGIGAVNYTIKSSEIVPATYYLQLNESHINDVNHQDVYLITCHPVGSSAERLIYIGELSSISPEGSIESPSTWYMPWLITGIFFLFGLAITYLFRDKEDTKINQWIILATVIILTLFMVYLILFPGSSQFWADNLGWLNGLIGAN